MLGDLALQRVELVLVGGQVLRPVQAEADALAQAVQFGLELLVGSLQLAEILSVTVVTGNPIFLNKYGTQKKYTANIMN